MAVAKMVYALRGRQRQLARKAVHVIQQLQHDGLAAHHTPVVSPEVYAANAAPLLAVIQGNLLLRLPRP